MNRLIVSCQELSWLQELFFHNSIPFDISIFPLGFYTKSVSVFKVDHAYADVCAGMSAIFFQENWKFPVPSLSNSTLPMFIQRTIIANLGGYSLELVLGAGVDIRTQSAIVDLIRHHAQLSSISTNLPCKDEEWSWTREDLTPECRDLDQILRNILSIALIFLPIRYLIWLYVVSSKCMHKKRS